MDLEARHTEFFLRIVGIEGGELADAPQSAMCGNRLAVFRESDSELLTDIDKRHRIEVFLHLDMAVGMDFGPAPLASLLIDFKRDSRCLALLRKIKRGWTITGKL